MPDDREKGGAIIGALGMLFLLLGLALAGFGLSFVSQARQAKDWPKTEGAITRVAVRSSRDAGSTTSSTYTELTYAYQVGKDSFTSSRYRLGEGSNAGDAEVARQWSSGDAVDVYYHPDDPSSSVLRTDTSWGVYVPGLLGLFFGSIGALLIFVLVRKPSRAVEGEDTD